MIAQCDICGNATHKEHSYQVANSRVCPLCYSHLIKWGRQGHNREQQQERLNVIQQENKIWDALTSICKRLDCIEESCQTNPTPCRSYCPVKGCIHEK